MWMSSVSLAQDAPAADLAEEAELHFSLAVERYKVADYAGALEHLLASNRLAPNKNVQFNIARTYERRLPAGGDRSGSAQGGLRSLGAHRAEGGSG